MAQGQLGAHAAERPGTQSAAPTEHSKAPHLKGAKNQAKAESFSSQESALET